VKGVEGADLSWSVTSVATATKVDIWRNNVLILTAANSGSQKDNINSRGAGSYTYRVCQSGTQLCSNSVTIVF
jgi:thermitase